VKQQEQAMPSNRWEVPYNFGALPALPEGYSVVWFEAHEHYQAVGPDDWESCITCDPYQARQWCFTHAAALVKQ
jgi:hypothetical protein